MNLSFLKVKSVPSLFWSSPITLTLQPPLVSVCMLIVGLFIFGLGEALLVTAAVGVSPWTVLADGVTVQTQWSLGWATFVISTGVLLLWIPLRRTPGIGTVLNTIIVAIVLQYSLPYLPHPQSQAYAVLQSLLGVFITGIGGAIYLIANLGPGPRDGLMTGLQAISGMPIAYVRSALEVTVVAVGWMLGGTAGLGTLLFAFGIGPSLALALYAFSIMCKPRV